MTTDDTNGENADNTRGKPKPIRGKRVNNELVIPPPLRDHRENAKLHAFYVNSAMNHLKSIETALELFNNSNCHEAETQWALMEVRSKLLKEEAAYRDAAWMLLAGFEPKDDVE